MNFRALLNLMGEDIIINSFVPLGEISILPRFIKRNNRLTAEVFYMHSDTSKGRYTIYPVSYRVLYDVADRRPVLMEHLNRDTTDFSIPIGTYQELLDKNNIDRDIAKEYSDLCEKIIAAGSEADKAQLQKLFELWEKCIPVEIKNTIV